jgi:hypothetical protein
MLLFLKLLELCYAKCKTRTPSPLPTNALMCAGPMDVHYLIEGTIVTANHKPVFEAVLYGGTTQTSSAIYSSLFLLLDDCSIIYILLYTLPDAKIRNIPFALYGYALSAAASTTSIGKLVVKIHYLFRFGRYLYHH